MTGLLYAIIVILVAGLGAALYVLFDLRRKSTEPVDNEQAKLIMEFMKEIKRDTETSRESVQKNIHETNKQINERLDNAGRVIADLTKQLGSISQVGPDIRRLSEVLASPKTRGNFGEEMLENMLSQVLPKTSYAIQHKFKNGEIVDAMIRVGDRILSIDSKFSMENFRLFKEAKTEDSAEALKRAFLKDVKKRIDEIHKKYILPQENTFDFALMYIPSEGVFSEIIDDTAIQVYAREKKVYCVSPNTLYHHLQIILLSLRGQQINKAAEAILAMVSGIKQESEKFSKNLDVLTNHIKNAGNTMGVVNNDYTKLRTSIANAATLQLEETKAAAEVVSEAQKLIE